MRRNRRIRSRATLAVAALAAGGSLFGLASPAFAGGGFLPGDLVIYETQGTTSASQSVDLVGYTTAGAPDGTSVALPTADSGSVHALTESGSALNDGELNLSADGGSLVATGYDAAPGVTKITSALNTPRTVAIVSPSGVVDTSTSLSDSTTEGSPANNFRSAITPVVGGNIYTGGDGGTGITTDGASSDTYFDTNTVHDVVVSNGQLYESGKPSGGSYNIYQVGSGLPTTGTPTETPLIAAGSLPSGFDPDQFTFVTLGGASTPNVLYVADGANGATTTKNPTPAGPNAVEKYSLENGVWTPAGSVTVPLAVGITASVTNGVVSLFVTGATATSAGNNTVLYGITDSSGATGTLSGTATTLATAPTGTDFKGLAFAPQSTTTGNNLPETPYAVLLPGLATVGLVGYLVYRRRRQAIG